MGWIHQQLDTIRSLGICPTIDVTVPDESVSTWVSLQNIAKWRIEWITQISGEKKNTAPHGHDWDLHFSVDFVRWILQPSFLVYGVCEAIMSRHSEPTKNRLIKYIYIYVNHLVLDSDLVVLVDLNDALNRQIWLRAALFSQRRVAS